MLAVSLAVFELPRLKGETCSLVLFAHVSGMESHGATSLKANQLLPRRTQQFQQLLSCPRPANALHQRSSAAGRGPQRAWKGKASAKSSGSKGLTTVVSE